MKCPRDASELERKVFGELGIDFCPECEGFMVNLEAVGSGDWSGKVLKRLREKGKIGGLVSPRSGQKMKTFVFNGVSLDFCEESKSVWFDRGEYEKILVRQRKVDAREKKDEVGENPLVSGADMAVTDVVSSGVGEFFSRSGEIVLSGGEFVGDCLGSFFGGIADVIDF